MPINPQQADSARQDLSNFLDKTVNFLRELCLERQDLFIAEFRPQITDAWNEFEEDFSDERAKERINAVPDDILQKHGLYGNQLNLKLSAIRFWREKFYLLDIVRDKLIEYLKWLIDAIDTLLKSLLEVTGISGAIEEIKDCLKTILDVPFLND